MENENIILTNIDTGLSNVEVETRRKEKKVNNQKIGTSKSYARIFFGNIFTWFNLICFLLAGLLLAVNSYKNLTFIVVFMINLTIGIVQEIKAKRMVDKISVIYKSKVKVLREKKEQNIDIDKIALDDILIMQLGDQIATDCLIRSGEIEVNESMLSGESHAVKKKMGDTLLGGSYIVSGSCIAQVTKVGNDTYSASLIKKARELKPNKSDILRTLNFIIKTIGIILIPLGILTFLDSYTKMALRESIERSTASIIGMMPVGMFLLTSLSLVVGVINLAKKKTLVQDLYSIEMLSRADVLCLDKTGTITDGTMAVRSVLPIDTDMDKIKEIMANYVFLSSSQNATSLALKKYFEDSRYEKREALSSLAFSSDRKFSALEIEGLGTFMLGASEMVTSSMTKEIAETVKSLSSEGMRVMLLCESKEKTCHDDMSKDNKIVAIITIEDNIRKDAKKIIEWFEDSGVEIKIISGDSIDTVRTIASKVGVKGSNKYISLDGMSLEEVAKIATSYSIFGRVSPEQKSVIVRSLKKAGKKVAMTGDGVNDILALKECDCSIAMASGSEATKGSSNLIMLDSDFSSMPDIVMEGRRVINNISRASSLFLTKTFFTMFLTIFVLIARGYSYPLSPNQIIIWEMCFIGLPAFFLALQPSKEKVGDSFIASLTSKALPGALVIFIGAIACYIYCSLTKQMDIISTLITYTATFGASTIMLNLFLPLNKYRLLVSLSMIALSFAIILLAPSSFFSFSPVTMYEILFVSICVLSIALLYPALKFLFEKFFTMTFKRKKKRV